MDTPNQTAGRRARLAAHLFMLGFLAVWSIYSSTVDSYVMPGPWAVAQRLWQMFGNVHEVKHMFYSFGHIIAAVIISFVIGSALALLADYVDVSGTRSMAGLVRFLNPSPAFGWTFSRSIWLWHFGCHAGVRIWMVPIPFAIINIREGLVNLDHERLEMAESFSRSRWRRFRLVVLPSLLPFIFATVRISFGVAWKVALTAELFGGNTGLGYLAEPGPAGFRYAAGSRCDHHHRGFRLLQ